MLSLIYVICINILEKNYLFYYELQTFSIQEDKHTAIILVTSKFYFLFLSHYDIILHVYVITEQTSAKCADTSAPQN